MTENERIRELRKALGLTLVKFGEAIGISNPAVSMIESGKSNVSDRTRLAICRAFNVNETWLRTGEGEMFRTRSRDEELAAFFGEITLQNDPDDEFKRRLLHVLSRLNAEEWKLLASMAEQMVEEMQKDRPE